MLSLTYCLLRDLVLTVDNIYQDILLTILCYKNVVTTEVYRCIMIKNTSVTWNRLVNPTNKRYNTAYGNIYVR